MSLSPVSSQLPFFLFQTLEQQRTKSNLAKRPQVQVQSGPFVHSWGSIHVSRRKWTDLYSILLLPQKICLKLVYYKSWDWSQMSDWESDGCIIDEMRLTWNDGDDASRNSLNDRGGSNGSCIQMCAACHRSHHAHYLSLSRLSINKNQIKKATPRKKEKRKDRCWCCVCYK